ncbi:MAG: protein BatD [Bacteroidales bacterium]|nr:protein BatD [Bacteroidales bacterium]
MVSPVLASAQDVSLKASSKSQVEVGEQFQVVYELNAEGSGFKGPAFTGLRVLNGPMSSTSSSIQIINGQMSRSFNQSYTYIVVASQEGSVTVPAATVNVKGKQYSSGKLTIEVVKSGRTNGSTAQNSSAERASVSNKDVFLRAISDKRKVVLGEQIIVTYRIYTRVPVSSVNVNKLSSFSGFWMKNLLDENAALQQTTEKINGEEYVIADIRKVALFPQKSGKLVIDPMELECIAQVQGQTDKKRSRDPFESFFNDPFFNRNIQNVQKKLLSESLQIDVEPLPVNRQSASFNGAVGQFDLQASIDKTRMKSNDAVNITYTVTGSGNLELFEFPHPVFPPDFELYEPKTSSQIRTTSAGISGSRKFEFLFIPRVHGNFKIPAVDFVYFDPKKNEFVTLQSKDFELFVEKGSNEEAKESVYTSSQEGIRYLGTDINHIKSGDLFIAKKGTFFFGSVTYMILVFMALALFAAAIVFSRKQDKYKANQSLVRYRKATKIARNRLKSAFNLMKQKSQNEF